MMLLKLSWSGFLILYAAIKILAKINSGKSEILQRRYSPLEVSLLVIPLPFHCVTFFAVFSAENANR